MHTPLAASSTTSTFIAAVVGVFTLVVVYSATSSANNARSKPTDTRGIAEREAHPLCKCGVVIHKHGYEATQIPGGGS
jgi:hypothetical protein